MADKELIEAVAKAIHAERGYAWPKYTPCTQCEDTAKAAIAAHTAHLEANGCVIVPVKPLAEMMEDASNKWMWKTRETLEETVRDWCETIRAMIAAAQKTPTFDVSRETPHIPETTSD